MPPSSFSLGRSIGQEKIVLRLLALRKFKLDLLPNLFFTPHYIIYCLLSNTYDSLYLIPIRGTKGDLQLLAFVFRVLLQFDNAPLITEPGKKTKTSIYIKNNNIRNIYQSIEPKKALSNCASNFCSVMKPWKNKNCS